MRKLTNQPIVVRIWIWWSQNGLSRCARIQCLALKGTINYIRVIVNGFSSEKGKMNKIDLLCWTYFQFTSEHSWIAKSLSRTEGYGLEHFGLSIFSTSANRCLFACLAGNHFQGAHLKYFTQSFNSLIQAIRLINQLNRSF